MKSSLKYLQKVRWAVSSQNGKNNYDFGTAEIGWYHDSSQTVSHTCHHDSPPVQGPLKTIRNFFLKNNDIFDKIWFVQFCAILAKIKQFYSPYRNVRKTQESHILEHDYIKVKISSTTWSKQWPSHVKKVSNYSPKGPYFPSKSLERSKTPYTLLKSTNTLPTNEK